MSTTAGGAATTTAAMIGMATAQQLQDHGFIQLSYTDLISTTRSVVDDSEDDESSDEGSDAPSLGGTSVDSIAASMASIELDDVSFQNSTVAGSPPRPKLISLGRGAQGGTPPRSLKNTRMITRPCTCGPKNGDKLANNLLVPMGPHLTFVTTCPSCAAKVKALDERNSSLYKHQYMTALFCGLSEIFDCDH